MRDGSRLHIRKLVRDDVELSLEKPDDRVLDAGANRNSSKYIQKHPRVGQRLAHRHLELVLAGLRGKAAVAGAESWRPAGAS
jgi:hypothetical protein